MKMLNLWSFWGKYVKMKICKLPEEMCKIFKLSWKMWKYENMPTSRGNVKILKYANFQGKCKNISLIWEFPGKYAGCSFLSRPSPRLCHRPPLPSQDRSVFRYENDFAAAAKHESGMLTKNGSPTIQSLNCRRCRGSQWSSKLCNCIALLLETAKYHRCR